MEDSLTNRIYKKSKASRVGQKLKYLGLKLNPTIFISFRFLVCFTVFLILFLFLEDGYIIAPLTTLVLYYFIEYFLLDWAIKKRTRQLEEEALTFFPVFLLNLKNNKNIKKALILSINTENWILGKEFQKVIDEVNVGKSLDEALEMLLDRCPSENIKNIIVSIMEANRMGNNVNDTIVRQLECLKEKKNREIINYYKLVPFKICFWCLFLIIIMFSILIFCNYFWG